MKLCVLFFMLSLSCFTARAQQVCITYESVFNKNFERGKSLEYFESVLNVSASESWFYSILKPGQSNNSMDVYVAIDTMFGVYKNTGEEALIFSEPDFSGRKYFYQDTLHPMLWNITGEPKQLGDFDCIRAETIFKGRKYIAWYCPTVPIANGPWKLGGLPGLIIEAFEENNDLYFRLASIKYNQELKTFLIPAKISAIPDYPDYKQKWLALIKKMDAAIQATSTDPGCVSCQTTSKSKIYIWEKWAE